uniref:Uncharacterized protein n=1 Tax=Rhizophora mucronata TaxID=61149 RepID=A0A2P2NE27_RHIMU
MMNKKNPQIQTMYDQCTMQPVRGVRMNNTEMHKKRMLSELVISACSI